MNDSLETIEEKNLYSRFGICDELTDEEMENIEGGWCFNIQICGCNGGNTTTNSGNSSGGGSGNGSGNGNGSSSGGGVCCCACTSSYGS